MRGLEGVEKEKFVTFKIVGKNLLIIHAETNWVKDYARTLDEISRIADRRECSRLACFFTREGTRNFLEKRGWFVVNEEKRIMEYVL